MFVFGFCIRFLFTFHKLNHEKPLRQNTFGNKSIIRFNCKKKFLPFVTTLNSVKQNTNKEIFTIFARILISFAVDQTIEN